MEKLDTHKFLYSLYYGGRVEGHTIVYIDKNNKSQKVDVKQIVIGASPLSCRVIDNLGQKHRIMFIRIKYVYLKDELVWENTDFDLNIQKIIKGYK